MKNLPALIGARDLKLFGGTQDNGTVGYGLTPDTNYVWISGGDGGIARSHPTDPEKIVTSLQLGVIFVRNTLDSLRASPLARWQDDSLHDGKARWHVISNILDRYPQRLTDSSEPAAFIAPVEMDEQHPSDLYTGRLHVYHAKVDYDDPEKTKWYRWSPAIAGDTAHTKNWYYGDIETIAVGVRDQAGHPMLWAGGYIYTTTGASVWRTVVDPTRPDTVAPKWISVNKGLPNVTISSIVTDRSDSLTAFVTSAHAGVNDSLHIFKTVDGGANWKNISGNLPHAPVSSLVIDTLAERGDPLLKNQILLAGTDVGVYVTTDGGASWSALGVGLPHIIISDLRIYKNMLIAATHGRSLYALDIGTLAPGNTTGGVAEETVSQPEMGVYPNPVMPGSVVHLKLAGHENHTALHCVLIHEATGVATPYDDVIAEQGGVSIELDRGIARGAYLVQVMDGNSVVAQGRISIAK
jgi:hypothetical protein